MQNAVSGLEIGRRRILHPGPLRWLRALGWMVALLLATGIAQLVMSRGGDLLARSLGMTQGLGLTGLGLTIVACFALYLAMVRAGEGRDADELTMSAAGPGLAVGASVGVGMFCAVMAALVLSGAYRLSGPHPASGWEDASMALGSGFLEELAMRAIVFRLVMRAFGVWPALAFSAALFGAGHLFNPNATAMAAIAIALEAGLSLAALYLATGNLWAPIGFHVAWNFVQAYVFGAHVSGIDMGESLWTSIVQPDAPVWLSGGSFGPEASAPAMIVGLAVGAAALIMAYRRGRLSALPDPGE